MPKDAQDISSGIIQNNRLRMLGLARNQLGQDGIKTVFGAMNERWRRHGAQPLEVDICTNGLQDQGCLLDWLHVEQDSDTGCYCMYNGQLDLGLNVEVLSLETHRGWSKMQQLNTALQDQTNDETHEESIQQVMRGPVQWPMCDNL